MKIHEIIQKEKMFVKYCDRYEKPLISYYGVIIPERIIDKFLRQATLEEIALYYFGYHNRTCESFPNILANLERHKGIEIPDVYGILTSDWWCKWYRDHLIEIMNQGAIFGR